MLSGTPTTAGVRQSRFQSHRRHGHGVQGPELPRLRGSDHDARGCSRTPRRTRSTARRSSAAGGAGGHTFSANGLPNGLSMNRVRRHFGHRESAVERRQVLGQRDRRGQRHVSYTKTMSIDVVGVAPTLPSIRPYGNALDDCTIGVPCRRAVGVLRRHRAVHVVGQRAAGGHVDSDGERRDEQFGHTRRRGAMGHADRDGYLQRAVDRHRCPGATATNTFPLKVSPLLQTTFLPNGTLGTAYSQTLRVIGGTRPVHRGADRRRARGGAHARRRDAHVERHARRERQLQSRVHVHRSASHDAAARPTLLHQRRRRSTAQDQHEQRSRLAHDRVVVSSNPFVPRAARDRSPGRRSAAACRRA